MNENSVTLKVGDNETISGVISVPEGQGDGTGIVLAHGAGNDMHHPMLLYLARGLAAEGYVVLRFNFLYRERGRKSPDSHKVLSSAWLSAFDFLKNSDYRPRQIVAAGKSLGGRIASQLVAQGLLPVQRLVLLGYPLHALGRKNSLRDEHLHQIEVPMLFFAGTRDPLCDLDLLRGVLGGLKTAWDLEVIEGGDHSFNVLRSIGKGQPEIYQQVLDKILDWL